MNRKDHWEKVYTGKAASDLTWFQEKPSTSLSLIRQAGLLPQAQILDVGGGTSNLSYFLLREGFRHVSVLDVSGGALAFAKAQLGVRAEQVEWFEADLLHFDPPHRWALWHDRAMFHFLTSPDDRDAYCRVLSRGLEPGGHLIIATFALDGPSRCSGLDCVRYSPQSLLEVLGPEYSLQGSVKEPHRTPTGGTQAFVYSWFQRRPAP
ncbi:class I SAM-dependent methyltransferase [Gemmatimonadota bacterium]